MSFSLESSRPRRDFQTFSGALCAIAPTRSNTDRQRSWRMPQWQKMTGIWAGTTVQLDRGSCKMRLELQSKPDAPEYFSGYSTRVCGPSLPFMNDKVTAGHLKDAYLNQITPVSDILSGIPINGSLTLNLDQAIAKSPDDCQLTSFTLTPFGQSQLAATFTQDKCQGGQLLMGRAR